MNAFKIDICRPCTWEFRIPKKLDGALLWAEAINWTQKLHSSVTLCRDIFRYILFAIGLFIWMSISRLEKTRMDRNIQCIFLFLCVYYTHREKRSPMKISMTPILSTGGLNLPAKYEESKNQIENSFFFFESGSPSKYYLAEFCRHEGNLPPLTHRSPPFFVSKKWRNWGVSPTVLWMEDNLVKFESSVLCTLLAYIGHLGYFIPYFMNNKADFRFKVLKKMTSKTEKMRKCPKTTNFGHVLVHQSNWICLAWILP